MAPRSEKLLAGAVILLLLFVGLVGVLEKGPPRILVYPGPSPLNTGPLGTSYLYELLRSRYRVIPVTDWESPPGISCGTPVLVIVSPELGYTSGEAESIRDLVGSCPRAGILVADESTISNRVLGALGLTTRILAGVIVDPLSGTPYPTLEFRAPWGWRGNVTLDIAAPLSSEGGTPIASGIAVLIGEGEVPGVREMPVAVYESVGGLSAVIIGDGSILLNQALASREEYVELALGALDFLCAGSPECVVLLEASKYRGVEPLEALRSAEDLEGLLLVDPLQAALAIILKALHPATWVPRLVSWLDSWVRGLIGSSPVVPAILIVLLGLLVSRSLLAREPVRVADRRLAETQETDYYGYAELRQRILRGRYALGKSDFISLYEMADSIFREVLGAGLGSPELPRKLAARGYGEARALRYWGEMNRLYRKATGRSLRPLIVFWGRTTLRLIRETEEVVRVIGAASL